jgi:hypothetical protein
LEGKIKEAAVVIYDLSCASIWWVPIVRENWSLLDDDRYFFGRCSRTVKSQVPSFKCRSSYITLVSADTVPNQQGCEILLQILYRTVLYSYSTS